MGGPPDFMQNPMNSPMQMGGKIHKFSIIELPFNEKARYSGISKTYPEFSLKYIILLYKYMVCLIKNVLISIVLNKISVFFSVA